MKTYYTAKEFIDKYDDKTKTLENFFKHSDRYTPGFYNHFNIDKEIIRDKDSQYHIPFEAAALLAGMIRSYSSAYGTDRRGKRFGNRLNFSYADYHNYIQTVLHEMKTMQPYQCELIKTHQCYRNAVIIDRFLPIVTERMALLIVALFSYQPDQSADDFIEVIHRLEQLIEELFKARIKVHEVRNGTPFKNQEYTFENAISFAFRMLADDTYRFSPIDQVQVVSPKTCNTLFKARAKQSAAARKQGNNSESDIKKTQEEHIRQLNELATSFLEKSNSFEKELDDATNYFNSFWDAKAFSDRLTQSHLIGARKRMQKAVSMACRLGEYYGTRNSISEIIKKQIIEAIDNENLLKIEQLLQDLYIYYEFRPLFPHLQSEMRNAIASGKTRDEAINLLVEEDRRSLQEGAKFQSQVSHEAQRAAICQYHEKMINDPAYKNTLDLLNDAISVLLPFHLRPQEKND